jgi:hypothetical protein
MLAQNASLLPLLVVTDWSQGVGRAHRDLKSERDFPPSGLKLFP